MANNNNDELSVITARVTKTLRASERSTYRGLRRA
jgi:hypothetical protein